MVPIVTTHPRHLQLQHRQLYFSASDIRRFKSPTAWLNDVCINDGAALLQWHLGGSNSDGIAIISTHAISTLDDGALWRLSRHSIFWQKSRWLVPIHHTTPSEHWVLGIMDFTSRKIGFFDSLADESLWGHDVQVRSWQLCHTIH
jgi:Ulp1 protease family, C-terminal catalytic domain